MDDRSLGETDLAPLTHDGGVPARGALALPAHLGPYAIEAQIGQGGMGTVLRGRGPDGMLVAVKAMRPGLVSTSALDRFAREGAIRIEHPNVIRTLGDGFDERTGMPWIAFELLDGRSLDRLLEDRRRLSDDVLLGLLEGICAGVDAVHRAGVVHRDLKPANVFVCDDGRVKVLDFGIALVRSAERVTRDVQVLGTLAYLAPEQARGVRDVDQRADVWAIGALGYEALTGRLPFHAETSIATLLAIVQAEPPPLARLAPDSSAWLRTALHKCLEKSPANRFADAPSFLEAARGSRASPSGSSATPIGARVSIAPGESRAVVLLLARGVEEPVELTRVIEEAGGAAFPLLSRDMVGVFGGRAWRGDEVRRAARVAIAARHLAQRVALATGRAESASDGVAGEALADAERAGALEVDGVALDRDMAAALGPGFLVGPVDERHVELLGESDELNTGEDAAAGLLVGRARELAVVDEALSEWADGVGRTIVVHGPVGSGKSRLRREIERRALARRPDAVLATGLVAAGIAPGGGPGVRAFGVFAEALRDLVRRRARGGAPALRRDAPPLAQRHAVLALAREAHVDRAAAARSADFLGELLGVPCAPSAEIETARREPELMLDRVRGALRDLFGSLASRAPLVLQIDDLRWADAPSVDLAAQLVRELSERAFLLVVAERTPSDGRERFGAGARRVELGPLAADEIAAFATSVAGAPVDAELSSAIHARTGGNPLFAEQVLRSLAHRGALTSGTGSIDAASLPLPFTMEAAVQAQLDDLSPTARDVCRALAVLGRGADLAELAAVGAGADATELERAVQDLDQARIVEVRASGDGEGLQHWLRSEIVAVAAYRGLTDASRAELHRRAAAYLDARRGRDAEEVALHHERAGHTALAAVRFAEAARGARAGGDTDRVLRCSARALALGAPSELQFELHAARADAFRFLRARGEQQGELDRAADHAASPAQRAQLAMERSLLAMHAGRHEEAATLADAAVRDAHASDDLDAVALAHARRAQVALRAQQPERAEVALAAAQRLAGSHASAAVLGRIAAVAANLAAHLGDVGTVVVEFSRAAHLHGLAGDVRRAAGDDANLADQFNRVGAYAEAEERLRRCLAAARRVGNQLAEGYILANLGYSLAWQEHVAEALAVLDEADAAAVEIGDERLVQTLALYRARALSFGEDRATALEIARGVASAAGGRAGALAMQAEALASRLALRSGDLADALERSARALGELDSVGGGAEDELEVFVARAEALEAAGRAGEAEAIRARGRARLDELAARVRDPEWRRRFVEGPTLHRALLRQGREGPSPAAP